MFNKLLLHCNPITRLSAVLQRIINGPNYGEILCDFDSSNILCLAIFQQKHNFPENTYMLQ